MHANKSWWLKLFSVNILYQINWYFIENWLKRILIFNYLARFLFEIYNFFFHFFIAKFKNYSNALPHYGTLIPNYIKYNVKRLCIIAYLYAHAWFFFVELLKIHKYLLSDICWLIVDLTRTQRRLHQLHNAWLSLPVGRNI